VPAFWGALSIVAMWLAILFDCWPDPASAT
jgi:hypothetical protein